MVLGSLFRQEAIDHQGMREPIDRVAQVTVPYDWWVLILLAVACLLACLWAAFVKVELTLPVDVIVIDPTYERTVAAPVTGRVNRLMVDVGSRVEAGDVLFRVEAPDLHRRLTEAEERERIIREEIRLTDSNDENLTRMLIESRVESATLSVAIENDEVVHSPFAGEVVKVAVSDGQIALSGQELVHIRVAESTDTFAITFISEASAERISRKSEVLLHCSRSHDVETFKARVISDFPPSVIESEFVTVADFDTNEHQLSLVLSDSATIANGTQCLGYVPIHAQTPLGILLNQTGASTLRG